MEHNYLANMNSLFDLTGKVAIVTGGSGILGRYFCSSLAQFGANVVVADINEESARDVSQSLNNQFGNKTIALKLDLTNEESVVEVVNKTVDKFGKIDILHNNAATKTEKIEKMFDSVEDFDMEEWDKIFKVNIDGMFVMARNVARQMIDQDIAGSIIQTSSIYGHMSPDQRIYKGSEYMGVEINSPAVYSASKAGVIGLTKYLSTYWAKNNIRVNTISPGGVESGQNQVFKDNYSNRIPMGRMANAQEMVGALIFLASDASSYVTGQNLLVDGGLSAW